MRNENKVESVERLQSAQEAGETEAKKFEQIVGKQGEQYAMDKSKQIGGDHYAKHKIQPWAS